MTREEAKIFSAKWLPAWTGNQPEKLAAFYTEDAFYMDPVVPKGVLGKGPLLAYFKKLLAKNPYWVWTQRDAVPMENGFVNKWSADIPIGDKRRITCIGVCLVEMRGELICQNEVYFDASVLK